MSARAVINLCTYAWLLAMLLAFAWVFLLGREVPDPFIVMLPVGLALFAAFIFANIENDEGSWL